jgi:hypothetical protein
MSLIYSNRYTPHQYPGEIKETEVKMGLTRQVRIRRPDRFLTETGLAPASGGLYP